MPTWAWVSVIAIVLLVVAALVAGRVRAGRQRTRELRARFGPEYDRAVKAHGRRKAEAELAAREQRRQTLEIVPLEREARERYATQWEEVQAQFVDSPVVAVSAA